MTFALNVANAKMLLYTRKLIRGVLPIEVALNDSELGSSGIFRGLRRTLNKIHELTVRPALPSN
jgi:hypothetical protein